MTDGTQDSTYFHFKLKIAMSENIRLLLMQPEPSSLECLSYLSMDELSSLQILCAKAILARPPSQFSGKPPSDRRGDSPPSPDPSISTNGETSASSRLSGHRDVIAGPEALSRPVGSSSAPSWVDPLPVSPASLYQMGQAGPYEHLQAVTRARSATGKFIRKPQTTDIEP